MMGIEKEDGENDWQNRLTECPVLAFAESHSMWGREGLAPGWQTKDTQNISFQMPGTEEGKQAIQVMLKTFQLVDRGLKSKLKMSSKAEWFDCI